MTNLKMWQEELSSLLKDFLDQADIKPNDLVVIGCSTSEVIGEKIGTAGSEEVADMLFYTLNEYIGAKGAHLAFQGCEHINRALVVERDVARLKGFEEVTVIPVRKAGGAMAACAYRKMKEPAVVEFIKADAGIDIGDTFIGMHLKHVAVPLRSNIKQIGSAHVTMAKTRPKLIGGVRAVYERTEENTSC